MNRNPTPTALALMLTLVMGTASLAATTCFAASPPDNGKVVKKDQIDEGTFKKEGVNEDLIERIKKDPVEKPIKK